MIRNAIFGIILAGFCLPLSAQTNQPMYLYVPNGDGLGGTGSGIFSAFKIDPSTGALSVVPGSPFQAGGVVPSVAVDPAGRFVYVSSGVNDGSGKSLWVFSVDQTTGSLTPLPGSPFTGAGSAIAIDPTGRFLYAPTLDPRNPLQAFSIDPVSGVPALISGAASLQTTIDPIAVDPGGNFLYFLHAQPNTLVTTDSIDFETGVPTPVGGTQLPTPVGTVVSGLAVDPLDRFVVINGTQVVPINPMTGIPTYSGTPPPAASGLGVFDPSGRFLYAEVDYCINPSVLNCGPAAYQVDPVTGALTAIPGSNFGSQGVSGPMIVDPTGHYLYALGSNPGGLGSAVYGFSVDQTTGAVTPLPSSPVPMSYSAIFTTPMAISFAPTGTSNPVPSISSFTPSTVTAGGSALVVTVNGSNFVPGSKVYFGGRGRVTTYVSSTQLTVNLLATDIAIGGSGVVFVYNPLPAGGASSSVEYPVIDAVPTLTSIDTTSVVAGGNGFTLTLRGAGFQPISVVTLNGTAQTTTLVNPGELQVAITAAEIAIPGTISVGVTTPPINGLGGGSSATLPLSVTPANLPPPVISQIAPGSATAGGPAFPLLITGVGFSSSSVVTFGAVNVPVTNFSSFSNGTTLTVSIPASAITTPGTEPVAVATAAGISPAVTFFINNPAPTAGGVNPPIVPAGSAALTLNVTGSGFVGGSTVLVNGASRVTTFINSTLLQATLLASDISHGGTLTITISSPGPGGGTSGRIVLQVADFEVSAVNATASVSAGQVANYTLSLAPSNGAYTNPVSFAATGLPAGASATFSSPALTPGANPANLELSISTTARSSGTVQGLPPWPSGKMSPIYLSGLILALCGIRLYAPKNDLRKLTPQFLLAMLLVAAGCLASCGGSSSGTAGPQGGFSSGTPAGAYSVVVTATSGADVHSTTVTLSVR